MNTILENAKAKMKAAIEHLKEEYTAIRAGRANPAVLDKVTVDYYGSPTPINQVAAVSVTEARVILIQPWDASILGGIEKAIQKSDIGINPQNDGKNIRLIFPQLTEDRRKEIDCMDKIKNLKKTSEITEDDMKKAEKKVQTFTDDSCAEIEKLCSAKTTQTMEI